MPVEPLTGAERAAAVAGIINRAYAAGEAGLWRAGVQRITPDAVAAAIAGGGMLAATEDGRIVGCARVWPVDATTWEAGLIAVDPGGQGRGTGRSLVAAAEARMRAGGATAAQLHLLVPTGRAHAEKERVRAWYQRLGYQVTGTIPFAAVASHGAEDLATPCAFLRFRKPLAPAPAMHLEHVAVVVDDYDAAIAFYVGALGFELVEDSPARTNDGRPKRWVVVRPPGARTGLLLARADGSEQAAAVGRQFAGRVGLFLRVADFDAAHARMRAAGVRFLGEPRAEPYGRVVVFEDVAGNRWDLLGP